jgi:hypothetical protein
MFYALFPVGHQVKILVGKGDAHQTGPTPAAALANSATNSTVGDVGVEAARKSNKVKKTAAEISLN